MSCGPAIAVLLVPMSDAANRSETQEGKQSSTEPPTQPVESPTQQIRAALVAAICDGEYEPFTHEAMASRRDAVARLRQLVDAYMTHLRSRGMPPERAVGFMKALIRDTEIPCRRPLLALETQIMQWCIDAYYGEPPSAARK
jgi:hypothetical protein